MLSYCLIVPYLLSIVISFHKENIASNRIVGEIVCNHTY